VSIVESVANLHRKTGDRQFGQHDGRSTRAVKEIVVARRPR
jgi:hypothetical protein